MNRFLLFYQRMGVHARNKAPSQVHHLSNGEEIDGEETKCANHLQFSVKISCKVSSESRFTS